MCDHQNWVMLFEYKIITKTIIEFYKKSSNRTHISKLSGNEGDFIILELFIV